MTKNNLSKFNNYIIVIINMPNQTSATLLAENLIKNKLAGCVNILAPCESIYMWENQIEKSQEIPLLVKTLESKYNDLESFVLAHHDYDIPEIIALPIIKGLNTYLNWINSSVSE